MRLEDFVRLHHQPIFFRLSFLMKTIFKIFNPGTEIRDSRYIGYVLQLTYDICTRQDCWCLPESYVWSVPSAIFLHGVSKAEAVIQITIEWRKAIAASFRRPRTHKASCTQDPSLWWDQGGNQEMITQYDRNWTMTSPLPKFPLQNLTCFCSFVM